VLDVRVYRAALAPALIALFVAAFSLADRPAAVTTPFAPAGFDGGRAYTLLGELGEAFPNRAPGSAGDRALAGRVAATFKQGGFRVTRRTTTERTVLGKRRLETVVGVRPGLSSHRIVVMAHRDALGSPALAELSGTCRADGDGAAVQGARAVLHARARLDLRRERGRRGRARVRGVRRRAGRRRDRARGPRQPPRAQAVDRAVVQRRAGGADGDPAHARVGGPARGRHAGRRHAGDRPVGAAGAAAHGLRAGRGARAGLPAVLLQASGERGPGARAEVSETRLDALGRSALRAVTALDRPVSSADETARSPTSRRASSRSAACSPTGRSGCWSGRCCCRRC
jgi:hypothetical protein